LENILVTPSNTYSIICVIMQLKNG